MEIINLKSDKENDAKIFDVDFEHNENINEHDKKYANSMLKFPKHKKIDANPNQVTDLRAAMKDNSRVNVFLGNKFAFSLTLAQVTDFKIKIGNVYSDEEIKEIKSASDLGKLYQRTLEYALSRPHSEYEIREHLKQKKMKREIEQKRYDEFVNKMKNDESYREHVKEIRKNVREKNKKLAEKDFTEDNRFEYRGREKTNLPKKPAFLFSFEDIEYVIEKLKKNKFINDENFARFFVENRNRIKGTSEKKLKIELKKKGVAESIINQVLSMNEFGEKIRNDDEEIMKMIGKKRRRGYDEQKLIQYLLRQGFSYDLIREKIKIEEDY